MRQVGNNQGLKYEAQEIRFLNFYIASIIDSHRRGGLSDYSLRSCRNQVEGRYSKQRDNLSKGTNQKQYQ